MKVVQINCVYNTGSTGKIVHDIHTSLLDMGIDSYVLYGRGQMCDETNVYKTSFEFSAKFNNVKSRFTGIPYNGSYLATNKLIKILKRIQPDIVHLHCINGFFVNIYKLMEYLKRNKIKTIITNHAEFFYTGACGHAYECEQWKTGCKKCPHLYDSTYSYVFDRTQKCWELMRKSIQGFDDLTITSVSPWVDSRAAQSPIMKGYKRYVVMNGIDTDVFKPRDGSEIRKKLGLEDKKVIVHVTASFTSAVKGGSYVIELAKRLKNDNVAIVVIGSRTPYEGELPGNIIDIGRVENQIELAEYYSMADLSLITGKKETFSMPVAESLCCGTSVAGFKAGGPESIALQEYSDFVNFGDMDSLEKKVRLRLSQPKPDGCAEASRNIYSKERSVSQYYSIYKT